MQRTEPERSLTSILTRSPSLWIALTACLPIVVLSVVSIVFTSDGSVLLGMLVAGRMWPIALIALAAWWIWCLIERLLPRTRRRSEKGGAHRQATVVASVTIILCGTLIVAAIPTVDILDMDDGIPEILRDRSRFHELVTVAHPPGSSSHALERWLAERRFSIRQADGPDDMQADVVGASITCNVRGWVNWTKDADGRILSIYDQVTTACI